MDKLNNNPVLRKQIKTILVLAIIVLIAMSLFIFMVSSDTENKRMKNEEAVFTDPLSHIDGQSLFLEKSQNELSESKKNTDMLQKQIDELVKVNKPKADLQPLVNDLKERIAALESKQVPPPNQKNNRRIQGSEDFTGNFLTSNEQDARQDTVSNVIQEDVLKLMPAESETHNKLPVKNPDTYVPSGTFVKAVMIGGADASAAVNSQSNPTPMLFRVIENGTLPNHQKSHLKDCVVTAAVVGDISSERGMIRLEKLSCVFKNKRIVDQTVEGTIFGSEAKNGVRGIPMWREKALLQRAFTAGTLSGLSDGISQTYTSNSVTPQGSLQSINPGKVFQVGVGRGVGKAMDKLAEYNIKRAEQYHPVIQISAGNVVDVVFLKGFFLDGKKHKDNEEDTKPGTYPISNTLINKINNGSASL
jgi:conjugal transfer pilus assembly protein TraB